jgi:hypothetical protein
MDNRLADVDPNPASFEQPAPRAFDGVNFGNFRSGADRHASAAFAPHCVAKARAAQ